MTQFSQHDGTTPSDDPYDLLPCGVIRTDAKQLVTTVNETFTRWIGWTAEDLIGKRRFPDLLSIGGRILFDSHHLARIELEGEALELQYELNAADGNRFSVTLSARKLRGGPAGFIYVVVPYNDRKKHEQELRVAKEAAEAADQAKSTFLSTMSHEIRTPLHAIIEGGNFLMKETPRPEQAELIIALRAAGRNLLSLVNDVLDVSKLLSGNLDLDPRPFHLRDVLQHLKETYGHLCKQKGVDMRFVQLSTQLVPMLMGDAQKISQVLNNLVSNAAKFTEAGEIVITVEHQRQGKQHELFFNVQDTGPGIAPDRLKAIFEPFTQASARVNSKFGGTGLGLAISQQIVQAHRSELFVVSQEGKGATFSFSLDLPEASPEDIKSAAPVFRAPEDLAPLNHLRVLNVDDNESNLMINARYFREWRLDFEQYTNSVEALEALENKHFDIILLDLRMPEIDGYELARRIRANVRPEIASLPLIALSASASKEVSAKMLASGINGLVLKPFEPTYLHHLIQRYGENRHGTFNLSEMPGKEPATGNRYDFSEVEEIFAGDIVDYRNFLAQIQIDLKEICTSLQRCTEDFSKQRMRELHHNMLSTVRVFRLEEIGQDLEQAKSLLQRDDKILFVSSAESIVRKITAFGDAVAEKIGSLRK